MPCSRFAGRTISNLFFLLLVPDPRAAAQDQAGAPADPVAVQHILGVRGDRFQAADTRLGQPPGVSYWSSYGTQVAWNGDSILVAAPGRYNANYITSALFFYSRNASSWTLDFQVSFDDVIGIALNEDSAFVSVGTSVVVFARRGTYWSPIQTIAVPTGSAAGMAVWHDTLAVRSAGLVFIFVKGDTGFSLRQTLHLPDEAGAGFGPVAIYGDTILAGQPWFDTGEEGSVYVFRRVGAGWRQEGKLVPGHADPTFGLTIALEGDLAAVGTASPTSGVSVFRREEDRWSAPQRLMFPAQANGEGLGPIALAGGTLLVGHPVLRSRGSVFVMACEGEVWVRKADLAPLEGPEKGFGTALAVDSTSGSVIVGAYDFSRAEGAAYLFGARDSSGTPLVSPREF